MWVEGWRDHLESAAGVDVVVSSSPVSSVVLASVGSYLRLLNLRGALDLQMERDA